MHSKQDWKKSSYSSARGEECVEISLASRMEIRLRDSTNPTRVITIRSTREWSGLIQLVKNYTI